MKRFNCLKYSLLGMIIGICFGLVAVGQQAHAYTGYLQPGPQTDDIKHMVLIYGNHNAPLWSKEDFKPYASHYSANGTYGYTADDFPDDWMYDSFLFLALKRDLQTSFVETNQRFTPAGKEDWLWLLDRWFNAVNGEILQLNEGVGELKTVLGDPAHKKKVMIGIPWPNPEMTQFGDVDGVGLSENLTTVAGRQKVVRWFIDEALSRWNAQPLEHLELSGFYWTLERIDGDMKTVVQNASAYIHAKPGQMKFSWIPFWRSNSEEWDTLGFDFAIQQPNLFFNRRIIDEETRTASAAEFAAIQHMGLELEIDDKLFNDPGRYWAFLKYLDDGYKHGYMGNVVTGTYQELSTINALRSRPERHYNELYDKIYQFLKGSYVPFAPQIQNVTPHNLSEVSGKVNVAADVSSPNGIARVEFYMDGVLVDTRTSAPYRLGGSSGYWDTAPVSEGTHDIMIKAFDTLGNVNIRTMAVDVYKALQNESFEAGAASWTFTASKPVWSGAVDPTASASGNSSYLISLPTGTATSAGDYAEIQQQSVYRTPSGPSYTLQFSVKDSYVGSTQGYHMKQVLVNDRVVWEQDVATDGTDWRNIRVNITDIVANQPSATVKLRVYEKKGVTSFHTNVWWDDVQIHRALSGGDYEAYYWRSTGNYGLWGSGVDKTVGLHGSRSWKISYPANEQVKAGTYGGVAQPVLKIDANSSYSVTFSHKDNYTGPAGQYAKQLLVDQVLVWEVDAASDGTDWISKTVEITPQMAGKSQANIEFRVVAKSNAANAPIQVHWDVVRSTSKGFALHNYSFEESDYHPSVTSTSGSLNWTLTTAKYSGALALSLYVKENSPTKKGDEISVRQDLRYVPNQGQTYLEFMQRDTRPIGSGSGYHKMQAWIDGVKVWEKDVASDGTAWEKVSVNISPYVAGKEHVVLEFKLVEANPVTNLNVYTYWDDVKLAAY